MLPTRFDKKTFGNAVRAEREKQSFSRSALAHEMGIHRTSLSNIESGKVTASPETVAKIEKALFGDVVIESEASDRDLSLATASVEEILEELKDRGFKSISLSFS